MLVVEDEPLIRDLIEQGLPVSGYRVTTFATGREALDWLATTPEKPAVLVTDVVMPGMSGRELADHAHERDPKLPVLFTSGYAENVVAHHGIVEEGIRYGADGDGMSFYFRDPSGNQIELKSPLAG